MTASQSANLIVALAASLSATAGALRYPAIDANRRQFTTFEATRRLFREPSGACAFNRAANGPLHTRPDKNPLECFHFGLMR